MESGTRKYAPHRIAGYSVTLLMHVGNIIYMANSITPEALQDKNVRNFGQLQNRFFTCWTFFIQILYASVALTSDVLLLKNSKKNNYTEGKYLRGFRNTLFAGILWPSTLLVSSIFWSVFLYDRNLIFPPFVDKVLTPTSNHIIHTAIVPVALWEIVFRPRTEPRSHLKNIGHLVFHMLLYMSVLFYTYYERDIWIYPIFKKLYGTLYFPIIFVVCGVLLLFYYHLQWTLTRLLWGKLEVKEKKKK